MSRSAIEHRRPALLPVSLDRVGVARGRLIGVRASVAQSPYNMGKFGVQNALKALQKQPVAKRIDTGTILVTKKNAAQFAK